MTKLKLAGAGLIWLAAALAFVWGLAAWPASAQQALLQPLQSTPDISVGQSSTLDVAIPGGRIARWISLRNDCSSPLYFSLVGTPRPMSSATSSTRPPLRLGNGESFTGHLDLRGSIMASADVAATAACTFTVIFAK